jgi:hypothetical protein
MKAPPDAVYSFKHVLVQDAAHASLLRSTRQQPHAQIYQVELPGPKLPVTAPVESRRIVADPVPVLIGMPRPVSPHDAPCDGELRQAARNIRARRKCGYDALAGDDRVGSEQAWTLEVGSTASDYRNTRKPIATNAIDMAVLPEFLRAPRKRAGIAVDFGRLLRRGVFCHSDRHAAWIDSRDHAPSRLRE